MVKIIEDLARWIEDANHARVHVRRRLRDAVVIYAVAGHRRAELLGTKVSDVHWVGEQIAQISIETQADPKGQDAPLKTDANGNRSITVTDSLALEVLRRRSAGKRPDQYLFEADHRPDHPWLPSNVGRDLRVFREWRRAQEPAPDYDLDLLTPRILRHTAASNTRMVLGLEAAQALCGHTSLTTTETYYAPVSTSAKAADLFNAA